MSTFTARLDKSGMLNSKYWYSSTNPFYNAGYGLPNCTCYAWGRAWEESGDVQNLPTGNGGEWWGTVSGFSTGETPKLGAIACFGQTGGAGHVAVVEEIKENGDIVTSNSGYSRTPGGYDDKYYFWIETNEKTKNYVPSWGGGSCYFQGFIYIEDFNPPTPTPSKKKSGKMPLWMYLKKW